MSAVSWWCVVVGGYAQLAVNAGCPLIRRRKESLHDTPGWTLPPAENLWDPGDQKFIEAVVIALACVP